MSTYRKLIKINAGLRGIANVYGCLARLAASKG